ncbi:unnamed protein product [Clonostachys rhizophaga]|uniref:Uncharacterized protein n=1 Tax=Clonostachys rhizophaga TaxID=160324 RepID=A0A9N9VUU5_9HYPO|nr:unnamed protein product [Clonostachys rhizophaga]
MELYLCLLLLSFVFLVSSEPNDSMITQAPDFIGWIRQGAGYEVAICEKGIFTSSRYWAACIDTDQPALPTRCRDGSVLIFPTTTAICPTTATCRTDWLFNDPADTAARTMIGCVTGTRTLYHYRTTTVPTVTSSAVPESSRASASASASASTSSLPPATSPDLAWIAGPIVGGLAGITLIILLVWFLMRRRNRYRNHPGFAMPETPDSEARPEKTPAITSVPGSLKRNPTRRVELPGRSSSLRSVP